MVVSVLPKKFYKTLCQTIVSWRFVITKTFHRKNHFLFTDFFVTNFFSSWLKVGSEISQRNSLYACFVFLSFLSNKFSKKLSNSLFISTELSISLLSIFNFLTATCVGFVFSSFRNFWLIFHSLHTSKSSYFHALPISSKISSSWFLQLIYSTEFISQFRFDSKNFSLFSREYCLLFFAFAKSFKNLILKQRISYFNTSHFTWLQIWLLRFNSPLTLLKSSFSLNTYSSLETEDLVLFETD